VSRQVNRLELLARLDDRPAPSPVDELAYFLKWGIKPWNALHETQAGLEEAILSLAPFERDALESRLVPLLQDPSIRTRLAYQFGPRFLAWLVDWRQPDRSAEIWRAAQSARQDASPAAVAQAALAAVARLETEAMPPSNLSAWLQKGWDSGSDSGGPVEANGPEPIAASRAIAGQPLQPAAPQGKQRRDPGWEDALFVEGAGVLLLHPFLERFFARCGLLDEQGDFRSPHSQATAVHLLHYLVSKQEQPAEEHTVLYELLCGMPFETPLLRELGLLAEQRQEAENLLQAVIDHWKKLGGTTPDGLREGFLQRSGRLAGDAKGWRLQVEQRSIDVLLEFLPWMISVARLPWMANPLWVDWA
jgi:hypothetical protein